MTPEPMLTCEEVQDLAPLFVTGALDADEMASVRAHLATCREAHDEFAQLGGAAQLLLDAVPPAEPSPALRTRILAAAAADLAEGRHPASARAVGRSAAASVVEAPSEPTVPVSITAPRRQIRYSPAALALAAAIIVVLGGLGVRTLGELQAAQAYRDGVSATLALAAQPGSQGAQLTADGGTASGVGAVAADGTVKIALQGLAATSGSQVYTAWAISGSGAPVPIGDFTVGGDGTAVITTRTASPAAGLVLALTLEPNGGATTPTMPIIVKGEARPASG
jgi:anti-sigma-K factor RskA